MNDALLCVVCFCGSYLHSLIGSLIVMKSAEKFIHNCFHIPYGFIGGAISGYNIQYGYIYFSMALTYQILEEVGNLVMYSHDKSWHDVEGYIIGFSYYILFLIFRKVRNGDKFYLDM